MPCALACALALAAPARAQPAPGCDAAAVGERLLDLFSTESEDKRVAAALALGACRAERAAGALGTVLARDASTEVRIAAATGLAALGTDEARVRLAAAARDGSSPRLVRASALSGLARLGDTATLGLVLLDPREDPAVRDNALNLLDKPDKPLAEETLRSLAQGDDALARAAGTRLAERQAAEQAKAAKEERRRLEELAEQARRQREAEELQRTATPPAEPAEPDTIVVDMAPVAHPPPVSPETTGSYEPATVAMAPPETRAPVVPVAPEAPAALAESPVAQATSVPIELRPRPTPPSLGVPALQPPVPAQPADGTGLAVATSTVAGSSLMTFLTLLAQQQNTGVLLLTGTAGAIIGGGTSWGLTRFYKAPTLAQAAWYANVTAWGTLLGLLSWTTLDPNTHAWGSEKAQWGALVAGETLGLGLGVWSSQQWAWTPQQMVLADSLVLGTALLHLGVRGLRNLPASVTIAATIGAAPAMVGSTLLARAIDPTTKDLWFMGTATTTLGWTGALVGAGAFGEPVLGGRRANGGLMAGLGAGYIGSLVAAAFSDVEGKRSAATFAAMAAGNLIGLGVHMALSPDDTQRRSGTPGWALGAGLGGLAAGSAAFAYFPRAKIGESWFPMLTSGLLLGGATWGLAQASAETGGGSPYLNRLYGGLLAGSVAGGAAGLLLSRAFEPAGMDYLVAWTLWGLGASAGFGTSRLAVQGEADPRAPEADRWAVLSGAALGLVGGSLTSHYTKLRGADWFAGGMGLGYGLLVGTLAPTLRDATWDGGRPAQGGATLGLALGAVGAAALAHATRAEPAQVAVPSVAGVLGLGIGLGTGLAWPESGSRPARVGAVAGLPLLALAAGLADRKLELSKGLGDSAPALGSFAAAFGAGLGLLSAAIADPSGQLADTPGRQRWGGVLAGASAGLASGLVLSKHLEPRPASYGVAAGTSLLGTSLGAGITHLAWSVNGRHDAVGALLGATGSMALGALAAKRVRLRGLDAVAGLVGLGYGAALGTLAPTLGEPEWAADRRAGGGALVGLALGAAGATAAAHALEAEGGHIALALTTGLFGMAAGTGFGRLWPVYDGPEGARVPSDTSQPARLGAFVGPLVLTGVALAADRKLELSKGAGPGALGMGTVGTLVGLEQGLLLAAVLHPTGRLSEAPTSALQGGLLFGASAGMATGLVLSKLFQPDAADNAVALSGAALGTLFGLGVPMLAFEQPGRPDTLGALLGSAAGLAGSAWAAHELKLRKADVAAALQGIAWGSWLGMFAPSLHRLDFDEGRRGQGGTMVGAAVGGFAAALASNHLKATEAEVKVLTGAGLFGMGIGSGVGLMWDIPRGPLGTSADNSYQPWRIGVVAGPVALGVAAGLLTRKLKLDEGFGREAWGPAATGGAAASAWGLMLAGAIDPSGVLSETGGRRVFGGLVTGVSAGVATGLLASKAFQPEPVDHLVVLLGGTLGGLLGDGLGKLATPHAGRAETLLTLTGSVAVFGAAAAAQKWSPLEGADGVALATGGAYGLLLGAIAPSLALEEWPGFDRRTTGWSLLALSAGALGATALRQATGAESSTVELSALGGLDGLLTGLGAGLLLSDTSRGTRIGTVAGTVAGLGIGALAWPNVELEGSDPWLVAASIGVGAFTTLFVPALAAPDLSAFAEAHPRRLWGGLIAGAGVGSFAASLVAPFVDVSDDLLANAVALHALAAGAGLGAGLVAGARDNATLGSMLGSGAAGLVLGGLLHERIEADARTAPLLTLAPLEGAWLGAWLPFALRPAVDVTTAQVAGGVLAGVLGASTLAAIGSGWWQPDARHAGLMGLGSVLGASIAGGLALSFPGLEGPAGVRTMLAGTTVGLTGLSLLAPKLKFGRNPVLAGLLGTLLGVSEGITFAWAGRAEEKKAWAGAALFGAGLGATLGLAASAYPRFTATQAPAAAGFAAWGAWMGSFGGALVNRDPHEVTFGGLIGANVGFGVGYGLLRGGLVKPADFGWLSLFAAIGTVAGAGVGAPFAAKDDPRPVLAGLSVGPAVGLLVGALVLPKLRAISRQGGGDDEPERQPAAGSAGPPALRPPRARAEVPQGKAGT